jgi:hypothetical protein
MLECTKCGAFGPGAKETGHELCYRCERDYLIGRLLKDLRHFEAEVVEHENGALVGSRKKARDEHRGQVKAYQHIVKHLKELVGGAKDAS